MSHASLTSPELRALRLACCSLALCAASTLGCSNLDGFTSKRGEAYCGTITAVPDFQDGFVEDNSPSTLELSLVLDTSKLNSEPGRLSSNDFQGICGTPEAPQVLFSDAPMRAIPALQHDLPPAGRTSYTRQQDPLGLGHAVWCARELVGNEPFALLLPDMVFLAKPGVLQQMMGAYESRGGNVIGVEAVDPAEVSSYGIVARGEGPDDSFAITGMVEKPKPADAPSNLIISGRYILQPEIFGLLGNHTRGAGGEIQLTDGMHALLRTQPFTGVKYQGKAYDCGSKIGFLAANVAFALDRPDIAGEFTKALATLGLKR